MVRSEERETREALRTLRRKLAEEHSVPPYVIFPDATLLEMLRSQPASLADMARISGVGARKLERYGQAFLEVLQGTVEVVRSPADLRHELVTLARAGMTPAQIARQLDCSGKNVYTLLAEAIGKQQLSTAGARPAGRPAWRDSGSLSRRRGELPPVGMWHRCSPDGSRSRCSIACALRCRPSSNCNGVHRQRPRTAAGAAAFEPSPTVPLPSLRLWHAYQQPKVVLHGYRSCG